MAAVLSTFSNLPPIGNNNARLLGRGRFKPCRGPVVRLHDGDLHAVGWGEGPGALVTPVKAIRVGVGLEDIEDKHVGRPELEFLLRQKNLIDIFIQSQLNVTYCKGRFTISDLLDSLDLL